MHVAQWKVAPHIPNVAEVGKQLPDDRLGLAAVRTFEVCVLDQGDGRLAGTSDMVTVGVDRVREVNDGFRGAQQSARSPCWWECGGDAEQDPDQPGGAQGCGQDAELGFLKVASPERQGGKEQAHREADAGDGAAGLTWVLFR